jgi:hypothetical protein
MGHTIITYKHFLLIFIIFIALISCGTDEITRSKAKSLITISNEMSIVKSEVALHKTGNKKGIEQGMWTNRKQLTSQGNTYFKAVNYSSVNLLKPVDINLEITGITNALLGQDIKEAQFKWNYINTPSVVKRYVVAGGSGVAYLRHYDDGWRLEEIKLEYAKEPAQLSRRELDEERKAIQAIQEARRAQEERERAERKRLLRLIKKSKKPNKIIGTFNAAGPGCKGPIKITLSDVDVKFSCRWYTLWFGDIIGLSIGDCFGLNMPAVFIHRSTDFGNQNIPRFCEVLNKYAVFY